MKLLIRWVITSFALFVAVWLVPGIQVESSGWAVYAVMAVILGLVNAFIRPFLKLLTCPLMILTLGLFTIVVNAFSFWLAAALANQLFMVGFYIRDFWAALLGSLVVSVVSIIMTAFVKDEEN